jgi:hypothetical protein
MSPRRGRAEPAGSERRIPMDGKVVFMHGFTAEEAFAAMRAVKAVSADPLSIAFSMSTQANLEWTVMDLIAEVGKEHAMMRDGGKEGA